VKKREPRQRILLAVLLLLPSAAAYVLHWAIFRNAHDIFFYLLMDIAFLFVQAVLATLVFDQLLNAHERQTIRRKLNVAMGVFFNQVGTPLLRLLSAFDGRAEGARKHLRIDGAWTEAHFAKMQAVLRSHEPAIDAGRGDLALLKLTLEQRREFLLRLLENPNLLEHETLTEMLWSVFHLAGWSGSGCDTCSISRPRTPTFSPSPCAPTPSTRTRGWRFRSGIRMEEIWCYVALALSYIYTHGTT